MAIEISWSAGSIDEARKVSRYLVQEGYVASAQITPWIESIYTWNNQLETSQETKVIFKTEERHLDKVKEAIIKNTRYEVPEILWRRIEGGNESYLKWLQEATSVKG
jgi:periplasmic divalent cation tolerance protein